MVETILAKNDPTIVNIVGDTTAECGFASVFSDDYKNVCDAGRGGEAQPIEFDCSAPEVDAAETRQRIRNMSNICQRPPVILAVCNREDGRGAVQFGHACAAIQPCPRRSPSLLKSPAACRVSGQGY